LDEHFERDGEIAMGYEADYGGAWIGATFFASDGSEMNTEVETVEVWEVCARRAAEKSARTIDKTEAACFAALAKYYAIRAVIEAAFAAAGDCDKGCVPGLVSKQNGLLMRMLNARRGKQICLLNRFSATPLEE
jgi:hypothetical protein